MALAFRKFSSALVSAERARRCAWFHVRVYSRLERYSPLKGYIRDRAGETPRFQRPRRVPSSAILCHVGVWTYLTNLLARTEANRRDLRSRMERTFADNVRHALLPVSRRFLCHGHGQHPLGFSLASRFSARLFDNRSIAAA